MRRPPIHLIAAVTAVTLVLGACSKKSSGPTAPPPPGDAVVTGIPLGAMLSVDGVQVGVTPRTVPDLSPGNHTFALAGFEGYADTIVVRAVAAGSTDTIRIDLRPLPGTPPGIETWNMPFIGGGQRETPYSVATTYAGHVWVAGASGTLYQYDASGSMVLSWSTSGMGGPASIAASNESIVYASSNGAAVGLYSVTGALIRFLSSMPTNVLDEWQPIPHPGLDGSSPTATGLFLCTADQLGTSVQVQRYDESNGQYVSRWQLHSDAAIPDPAARYAACDAGHHVFVGVSGNGQTALDKYDSDGAFLQRWSPFPDQKFDVDETGHIYSIGPSTITRMDLATGTTHRWRITGGSIQTIPAGVSVNPDGLYIADSANRRIIRYVLE